MNNPKNISAKRKQLWRRLTAKTMITLCSMTLIACQAKSDEQPTTTAIESTQEISSSPTVNDPETTTATPTQPFDPYERPELDASPTLQAPVVSHVGGMYAEPFVLSFQVPDGQYVYYTIDGSDPRTSKTATLYTEPLEIIDRSFLSNVLHAISPNKLSTDYVFDTWTQAPSPVDKCTVIRACAATETGQCSPTITNSYFVGKDNSDYNDLVILSLSTNSEYLFDNSTGIYCLGEVYTEWKKTHPNEMPNGSTPANYNQRGKEWEREAHVEIFKTDGTSLLSQDCGIRIQGGWSRAAWQKSFRLFARKSYGEGNFQADLFDGLLTGNQLSVRDTFDTLLLRNGGNDAGFSKLKDALLQSLVRHRNFETQYGRPAVLFLNGEYWGLYTLQEDYSADYFKNNYGVKSKNVLFYKNGKMEEGTEEDEADFWNMVNYIKEHDLTDQAVYHKVQEMIDLDSFIDYMATEIYINNQDWPGGNYGMWRVRTPDSENPYADGRWRMLLFDTEYSTNMYGDAPTAKGCWQNNNLQSILSDENDNCISTIFKACMKNKDFQQQFVLTVLDLMNVEYAYNNFCASLNIYKEQYLPELARHFLAFPGWQTVENAALPCLERMSEFFRLRATYVVQMLTSTLELSGKTVTVLLSSSVKNATVTCNSSPITLSGSKPFSGTYLTDYPITVTANDIDGYRFVTWDCSEALPGIDLTQATITIPLRQDIRLHAVYTAE